MRNFSTLVIASSLATGSPNSIDISFIGEVRERRITAEAIHINDGVILGQAFHGHSISSVTIKVPGCVVMLVSLRPEYFLDPRRLLLDNPHITPVPMGH